MQPPLPQRIMKINHPSGLEKTGLRQTNPKRTQFKPNFPGLKLRRLLTTVLTNRMVRKMAIISAMSNVPAHPG